jgi:hypothetical protein
MWAFSDDSNISLDTCVLYSLEQAALFEPYCVVRSASSLDLAAMIAQGRLHAAVIDREYYVTSCNLDAFVSSGGFNCYWPEPTAFRCDSRLFFMLDLARLGYFCSDAANNAP